MQVRVGRTRPEGFLPVYSVDSEAEAKRLVTATCSLSRDGHYYSDMLAAARQTEATTEAEIDKQLDSLDVFSDQLDAAHERMKKNGLCKCKLSCGYQSDTGGLCLRAYDTPRGLAQHQARVGHKTKRATTSR